MRNNNDILDFISGDDTIVFTGAGVSYDPPSGLPLGQELVQILLKSLVHNSLKEYITELSVVRPEAIMQVMHEIIGNSLFNALADMASAEPNHIHKMLEAGRKGSLFNNIVTTNIDMCHEAAGAPKTSIIHLHGSADHPDTILYALNQVGKKSVNTSLTNLTNILEGKTIVFLGYSGADDFDIAPILKNLQNAKMIWFDHIVSADNWQETTEQLESKTFGNIISGINSDHYIVIEGNTRQFISDWLKYMSIPFKNEITLQERKPLLDAFREKVKSVLSEINKNYGTLILSEIYWRYLNDRGKALKLVQMVDIENIENNIQILAHRIYGFIYYREEMFTEAQEHVEKAIRSCNANHIVSEPLLFKMLGNIHYSRKEYDSAIEYYHKGIESGKNRDGCKNVTGLLYVDLGMTYQDTGSELAQKYFDNAIDLLTDSGDLYSLSDLYNVRGLNFLMQTDFENAENEYIRAIDLRKSIGHYQGLFLSYLNLATLKRIQWILHKDISLKEEAMKNMNLAYEGAKLNGNKFDFALMAKNYAHLCLDIELFDNVQQYLDIVYNVFDQPGDVIRVRALLQNIELNLLTHAKDITKSDKFLALESDAHILPVDYAPWVSYIISVCKGESVHTPPILSIQDQHRLQQFERYGVVKV